MKYIIITIILSAITIAYPVVISDSTFDHQMNKEFIHWYDNIKALYYVDKIYFYNEPWVSGGYGFFHIQANKQMGCYDTTIWLVDNDMFTIEHELCHIQYHCIDHKKEVNETHANTCELYKRE